MPKTLAVVTALAATETAGTVPATLALMNRRIILTLPPAPTMFIRLRACMNGLPTIAPTAAHFTATLPFQTSGSRRPLPITQLTQLYLTAAGIQSLKIESSDGYVGFFGYIRGGKVTNLTLENPSVSGGSYVGAIARYNYGGSIVGCTVLGGTVTGSSAGGIAGWNYGTVSSCKWLKDTADKGIGGGTDESTEEYS